MKKTVSAVYFILFAIVSAAVIFILLSDRGFAVSAAFAAEVDRRTHTPVVIYIPGYKTAGVPQDKQTAVLQKIYPGSKIIVKYWESNGDFESCRQRADKFADYLAEELSSMSSSEQKNLILVGHSLGGRIAIRTMAKLVKKGIFVKSGIFLAAAIPDDDPDIAAAIKGSLEPNVNIYNRLDYILRHIYGIGGENLKNALGAYGYAYPFQHKHLLQFENISSDRPDKYLNHLENHFAVFYMNFLKEKMPEIQKADKNSAFVDHSTAKADIDSIQVLYPDPPMKIIDLSWENVDEIKLWRLQRKKVFLKGMVYRIVDPKDFQRAHGSEEKMRESFQNIRKQLLNGK